MEGVAVDRQWYAIRTQPRKEKLAESQYSNQGFESFSPMILGYRRHARRVERVAKPLFPGYLFLFLTDKECRMPAIYSTIGAVGPVKFGDYYPPVPRWVIEGIKARVDDQGFVSHVGVGKNNFSPGDRVRVEWLDYKDLEGIFQAQRGEDRALILLNILKRQVRAVVPIDCLWAA